MKIIEKGTLPDNREYTVRCAVCSTKFSFTGKEATRSDGDAIITYSIKCPTCGNVCSAWIPASGTALQ